MEKVIKIGDKEVGMKSTAGTMMRYRNICGRDFIKDLIQLQKSMNERVGNGEDFDAIDLEIFEKIAWCMAKTYDNSIPDIEPWLDQFETFDIMQVLPEIMNLLVANMEQINTKKKTTEENQESK